MNERQLAGDIMEIEDSLEAVLKRLQEFRNALISPATGTVTASPELIAGLNAMADTLKGLATELGKG